MTERSLAEIDLDEQRAKLRLNQVLVEKYAILVRHPCSLCGALPGQICRKGGTPGIIDRGRLGPYPKLHAERHRVAREAIVEAQREKL